MITTTWAETQSMMSVNVNGVAIPFKAAPDNLQRFTRPAFFTTGDEAFELRFSGTAFMGRYRNFSFALTTAHQIQGGLNSPSATKFVVVAKSQNKQFAVPPFQIYGPNHHQESFRSLEDILLFEFKDVPNDYHIEYLDLCNLQWSDCSTQRGDYSFALGYPTKSVNIELNESDESKLSKFTAKWVRLDLLPASPQLMDIENRNIFEKHHASTQISIDPDGLSGAPVFTIVSDSFGQRTLRFDGIITHAKGDRFAIYPSECIRDFLDAIVSSEG
ncbi:hypothetical protein [Phyllobacterium sp. P30BS-XVII]|uniref:hypothetical protein n=1 Tax=Phyllobacterium sp. P30BS-XVII TaxID=2587046 RepID=UPI0015FBE2F5|nr:hypothetical protein [Phyllobacterium sp. P30BS-XVII]MBA8904179.1 hypothetical protein [Phyllobacterium sp. P30BS-XVII]